ncbi:hypothetical protein [Methylobacterium sp. A54F]
MAFFIGIGGPWIVLMALDLLATKRDLASSPLSHRETRQERLERLLRRREVAPRAVRAG